VGDPVVLVHSAGAGSDARTYSMIHVVKRGSRSVTFDRRGHRSSREAGGAYDYDMPADDLATVMESFDIRGATLVGHAMSCREVVRYLTRHSTQRVSRVALVTPALPFEVKTPENPVAFAKHYFALLRAKWARQYPSWLAANAAPFCAPETSQQMVQWGIRLAYQTSLLAAIESNLSVTEMGFREELDRIGVPTLVVKRNADMSRPLEITEQPTPYEGAPQGVLLTHMEQLNVDLMRFAESNYLRSR
jgi:pimeloyl-ACP methyl ester carboxylesterase